VKCQERLVAGGYIGLVGWLRDGALAHPRDHARLVEQDLAPPGRGRRHDRGQRVQLPDQDRWHTVGGLADLLE
jgi:hypothetical protein